MILASLIEGKHFKRCRYCTTSHSMKAEKCMHCEEPFNQQLAARIWNRVPNEDFRRVIRVKSLRPYWDSYSHLLAWPSLLVDTRSGDRSTVPPLWNWARLRNVILGRTL